MEYNREKTRKCQQKAAHERSMSLDGNSEATSFSSSTSTSTTKPKSR